MWLKVKNYRDNSFKLIKEETFYLAMTLTLITYERAGVMKSEQNSFKTEDVSVIISFLSF